MTTIEAKVNSMFSLVDVVEAMLDTNCLLLARVRLGLFFYNAMIDVETSTPYLKDADCVWKLLFSTIDVFAFAKDDLRQIEKNGWNSVYSNRQKIEYMIVCLFIIHGYFKSYYDDTIFKPEVGQNSSVERVQIKETAANELIKNLFTKILSIYEMVSPILSSTHHELFHETLEILNSKASTRIVANVEKIHERFMIQKNEFEFDEEYKNEKMFDLFVMKLKNNENINKLKNNQIFDFIGTLQTIPLKDAISNSEIRFEPLIEKLVSHVRQSIHITIQGDESLKTINSKATETGIWVTKQFRTMIENRWGMNIFERDEDGGEEEDKKADDLIKFFNLSGMVEMCLDLIAKGIDSTFQVFFFFFF
jgi:hypothetical protein